jgi:hypothetical protein
VAMNEYPSMDDLALRILEVLAPIFPRDANFEDVVAALPNVNHEEILCRIDDMQKLMWIDGALIRNGFDKSVKAVYRCHLTEFGRNWLQGQGVFDLGELAELCERKFKSVRDFAYDNIRAEFRPIMDHYEKTGIHEFSHFVESTCELIFDRLQRIKDAFLTGYLKTVEGTSIGITSARKIWLLRVLNEKWEHEIQRAQEQAELLTGAAGFPSGRAHTWIANLVGRGRELKGLLANDINVALLERAHRAPERNSVGTIVVMRDQNLNYGQAGAIGECSSGVVSERLPSSNRVESHVDLHAIGAELGAFRKALRAVADTVELDELVVVAGRAQNAAEKGSESEALEQIARLGGTAAHFAREQGLSLLSEIIVNGSGTER